jgi:uncharacterized membrane protein YkvA (DUF1232 family)
MREQIRFSSYIGTAWILLMKKPAKKGSQAKPLRHSPTKAALRSDAFARAERNAKSYAQDPKSRGILVEKAARKAASAPQDVFSENWPYLQTMLRLVRAHTRGEYRDVSEEALLSILAALAYLVDPFDLIPDEIPFLGYVDDATVVDFAVVKAKRTLDDFMIWETTTQ